MAAPRTSFVIPARNAAPTLAQTLDSLLAQGDGDWEALIVDDGSSDETPQLIAAHAQRDARFIALRGSGTPGASAARNVGLHQARGQRIVFLDSDDWIEPGFLERMNAALDAAPDAGAAYCDYRRVMPDGERSPAYSEPDVARAPFDTFARTCAVAIHAVLIEREWLLRAGGFDTTLATCEDWDLWQRVARLGSRWVHVAEPLALYRTGEALVVARCRSCARRRRRRHPPRLRCRPAPAAGRRRARRRRSHRARVQRRDCAGVLHAVVPGARRGARARSAAAASGAGGLAARQRTRNGHRHHVARRRCPRPVRRAGAIGRTLARLRAAHRRADRRSRRAVGRRAGRAARRLCLRAARAAARRPGRRTRRPAAGHLPARQRRHPGVQRGDHDRRDAAQRARAVAPQARDHRRR